MKYTLFFIFTLVPHAVFADPGHGNPNLNGWSIQHFLIEPIHLVFVIFAIGITVLLCFARFLKKFPLPVAYAHCDGPCGVYDPAQARVTAEAVRSMTKKILDLKDDGSVAYQNTLTRYVQIKEEQAQQTKDHLLILWTDYFKPEHLETFPDLHGTFWQAAKLCSKCKVEVSLAAADELLTVVKKIHEIFWKTKGRDVPWVQAVK